MPLINDDNNPFAKKIAQKDRAIDTLAGDNIERPLSLRETVFKIENNVEVIELENYEFNYGEIEDNETIEFLKTKEKEIHDIVQGSYTKIGQILKEAQEKLSSKGYGTFLKWCSSIGFKKDTALRLITRFEFIMRQNEIARQRLEALPISMVYEVARLDKSENLPEEEKIKFNNIKQQVLDGKVSSRKELLSLLDPKTQESEKIQVMAHERNIPVTADMISDYICSVIQNYNPSDAKYLAGLILDKYKISLKK